MFNSFLINCLLYEEYFFSFSIENLAGRGETTRSPQEGHFSVFRVYLLHFIHLNIDLVILSQSIWLKEPLLQPCIPLRFVPLSQSL